MEMGAGRKEMRFGRKEVECIHHAFSANRPCLVSIYSPCAMLVVCIWHLLLHSTMQPEKRVIDILSREATAYKNEVACSAENLHGCQTDEKLKDKNPGMP